MADAPAGTVAEVLLARANDPSDGLRTRDRTWSWDDVVTESARRAALATSLRREGPFHIGVLLDNVPEFLFWLGGAALSGATIVGLNPTRRGAELAHEVTVADCQLVVTDAAGASLLAGLDGLFDAGAATDRIVRIDDPGYDALVAAQPSELAVAAGLDASTLYLLLFTSGTTGRAKAVRCTNGRLVGIGQRLATGWGFSHDTVSYCCMPLFHGNALMSLWIPTLVAGGCIALPPKFSASQFLDDVRRFGATYFTYVGKAIAYVLAEPERPDDAGNPLQSGFGTEASPADRIEFRRRFGCTLVEGYGSSEGAGLVAPDPATPLAALGRPLTPGVVILNPDTLEICAVARLDEHGRVTNPDQAIGEIVGRDAVERFEGYYNNPDANAERTRRGWYWTGDLGFLDDAGYIHFAGRKGDWVRVDGENLSTLHVESVLRRHPDIALAAAYAVPDVRSGDQMMTAVELTSDAAFDAASFARFLAGHADLAPKAIPRFVRVSPELPTTGSSKILKRILQSERWNAADPVYVWAGRGRPEYRLMTAADRQELEDALLAAGRSVSASQPTSG